MGHPRKKRKKYTPPRHPWQAERLERENNILEKYSLKNKKEIWKMQSILNKYSDQAKKLANARTEQAKKEKNQMVNKLFKLGLVKKNADVDDVLSLNINDVMNRRLQTMVYKKNMANTPKQARQFVVHGHVLVGGKKVNAPSYLVDINEENQIVFKENSNVAGRFGSKEEEEKKKAKKIDDKGKAESKEEVNKHGSEGKVDDKKIRKPSVKRKRKDDGLK